MCTRSEESDSLSVESALTMKWAPASSVGKNAMRARAPSRAKAMVTPAPGRVLAPRSVFHAPPLVDGRKMSGSRMRPTFGGALERWFSHSATVRPKKQ